MMMNVLKERKKIPLKIRMNRKKKILITTIKMSLLKLKRKLNWNHNPTQIR